MGRVLCSPPHFFIITKKRKMKKTIVVTGASGGVGFQTALLMAGKGHNVYATMCRIDRKEKLLKASNDFNVKLNVFKMDVTDQKSIDTCMEEIIKREGKIDVLINTTAVYFFKPSEMSSDIEIQRLMNINYYGIIRVTNAVLPYMKKIKSGHIINISSVCGLVGQPFNEIYCATKFAIEGYTEALSTYLTPFFNLKFTIIEPDEFDRLLTNGNVSDILNSKVNSKNEYLEIIEKYFASSKSILKDNRAVVQQSLKQVAEVINYCIETETPPLRIRTSNRSEELCSLKTQADPNGLKSSKKVTSYFFN